jgi:hypothetical protein
MGRYLDASLSLTTFKSALGINNAFFDVTSRTDRSGTFERSGPRPRAIEEIGRFSCAPDSILNLRMRFYDKCGTQKQPAYN